MVFMVSLILKIIQGIYLTFIVIYLFEQMSEMHVEFTKVYLYVDIRSPIGKVTW